MCSLKLFQHLKTTIISPCTELGPYLDQQSKQYYRKAIHHYKCDTLLGYEWHASAILGDKLAWVENEMSRNSGSRWWSSQFSQTPMYNCDNKGLAMFYLYSKMDQAKITTFGWNLNFTGLTNTTTYTWYCWYMIDM